MCKSEREWISDDFNKVKKCPGSNLPLTYESIPGLLELQKFMCDDNFDPESIMDLLANDYAKLVIDATANELEDGEVGGGDEMFLVMENDGEGYKVSGTDA